MLLWYDVSGIPAMWEIHVYVASMMILEFLQMWEIRYCGKCDVMGIPAMWEIRVYVKYMM